MQEAINFLWQVVKLTGLSALSIVLLLFLANLIVYIIKGLFK